MISEKKRISNRLWRQANPEKVTANRHRHYRKTRLAVINGLGGVCEGCGCDEFIALTLDHIHGGGEAHKRALGSSNLYAAILKEGLPRDKYRCLCWNCQHKARMNYPLPTKMADPRLIEVGA